MPLSPEGHQLDAIDLAHEDVEEQNVKIARMIDAHELFGIFEFGELHIEVWAHGKVGPQVFRQLHAIGLEIVDYSDF